MGHLEGIKVNFFKYVIDDLKWYLYVIFFPDLTGDYFFEVY